MIEQLKLRAYAKINLTLKILGLREDGFHDIETIMQSISLHDLVSLKLAKRHITIKCDNKDVPSDERNLAYKAAKLYFDAIAGNDEGVEIHIKKNIPVAAGLGGGAADAAAVLYGLNLMHDSKLHSDKLHELASKIGSDVPFCLAGGTAKCTGRGDIIKKINPQTGNTFILAMPDIKVPTKDIYDEFDKIEKKSNSSSNDLEQVTFVKYDSIKRLRDKLVESTKHDWIMSGSGPVLFTELRDLADIDGMIEDVAKMCKYNVALMMNEGVTIIEDAK